MASSLFIEARFGVRIPASFDRYPARGETFKRYGVSAPEVFSSRHSTPDLEEGYRRALANPNS